MSLAPPALETGQHAQDLDQNLEEGFEMFEQKAMPATPMSKEEMELQGQVVSAAAPALDHFTEDELERAKRNLTCACCGETAGGFEQHWNRDIGFGVCRKCVNWQLGRGVSLAEIQNRYGIEGVNYAGKAEPEAASERYSFENNAAGYFTALEAGGPVPIDEETFYYFLEVLPPKGAIIPGKFEMHGDGPGGCWTRRDGSFQSFSFAFAEGSEVLTIFWSEKPGQFFAQKTDVMNRWA